MSQRDFIVSVTGVPAATLSSSERSMSRLWAPSGAQPKSLPDFDHHSFDPDGTISGSMIRCAGSFATYASPLFTDGPVSVYGVPFSVTQSIRWVFAFESFQPLTVVEPASRTRGTSQP